MATPPVVRFPIFTAVRAVGVAVTVLLLTWAVHFRGGLALVSDNKDLIFNVTLSLSHTHASVFILRRFLNFLSFFVFAILISFLFWKINLKG